MEELKPGKQRKEFRECHLLLKQNTWLTNLIYNIEEKGVFANI